jgi:predicted metalloprotease
VVGLWIAGVVNKHTKADNYAQPQPVSTAGPNSKPSRQPTQEPATADPTAPKPTKPTPPPPRKATPYEIVSRNKFYRTGLQPGIGCRESGARASSIANAVKYYAVVKGCADKGWPRQVRAGGWPFVLPRTIVMSAHVQSPCAGNAPTSFYCSSNQTIYMAGFADAQRYKEYRGAQNQALLRAGMAFTVAHEYGHHVQELTGILDASESLGYATGTTAGEQQESRRLELQASCLAGVFLAANRNTYPFKGLLKSGLDYWVNHSGDEADPTGQRIHGTMRNHGYWFHRGYNTRNIASCNTYLAPSSLVA